jgi:serine/threonine protein kinase
MLLPHALTDEMAVHRFHREVDLARRLEHPNTVRIFDRGQTEAGLHFYVMECVKGGTLGDILEADGALSAFRTKRITEQILMSLGEAHSFHIVHRDLKPGNVMIGEVFGQQDFVKVLDFGIGKQFGGAKEEEPGHPTTVGLIGTPLYMSPEQCIGLKDLDGRSDLYALGLMMTEMLTGQRVYDGPSPLEILMAQATSLSVPIPPAVAQSVLGRVILRAVEKDRDVRFRDAEEMLKALQAVAVTESGLELPAAGAASTAELSTSVAAGRPPPESSPTRYVLDPVSGQMVPASQPIGEPVPPPSQPMNAPIPVPSGQAVHTPASLEQKTWHDSRMDAATITGETQPRQGLPAGTLAAVAIVFALAVVAFLVMGPLSGDDEDGAGTDRGGGAALEPDPRPIRPDPISTPTSTPTPALTRTQTRTPTPVPTPNEPVVVTPLEPAVPDIDYGQVVQEGLDFMVEARWEEALGRFQRVPEDDALYAPAQGRSAQAQQEIHNRVVYQGIIGADSRGAYDEVQTLRGQLPAASYYHRQLEAAGIDDRLANAIAAGGLGTDGDPGAADPVGEPDPDQDAAEPAPAIVVHVTGSPRRARVYIGDDQICRIPCDVELPPGDGPVEVRVRASDHHSRNYTLEREAGSTVEVRLRERVSTYRP